MRSDGSRCTTEISRRRERRCAPRWSRRPRRWRALALLARTRADTAPVTGRAFLALARGDTAAAAAGFEKAADGARRRGTARCSRPPRGSTRRITASSRRSRSGARSSQKSSDTPEAPEAELDWARALRRGGQAQAAIEHLEHLILTYPQSALLPQARRELELSRNGIPPQS